jgi:methylmalonyl-CoA mutase N-terminal domain/subunit
VEALTNEVEARAWEYIEKIDGMGGSVQAIEAGWIQDEIHESAYLKQHAVETEEQVVVGVNRWVEEDEPVDIQAIDEAEVEAQKERVRALRADRDQAAVDRALADVTKAAEGTDNLLPPMREALRARATLGEVSDALREVFGVYQPTR